MIDWKTKLTSRKLWMAIIGFVTGLLTYFGVGTEQVEQIGSLILMGASIAAYIIGEGLADAAGAANSVNFVPYDAIAEDYDADDPPDEEDEEG